MNKFIKIAALLFGISASAAWAAAEPNTATLIPTAKQAIPMQTSKGQLIRLSRAASAVFVADTRIADVSVRSPRMIYLYAKLPGETTLYAVDSRDRVIIAQRVTVGPNLDRVRELFRQLRPYAPVRVEAIGDQVVITGTVESADIAEEFLRVTVAAAGDKDRVVNRLRVNAPNQVNIRVKMAEVSRDINKRIGINWELIGQATPAWALGFAVGSDIVRDANGAFIVPNDPIDRVVSSVQSSSINADVIVDLLDDEGLITVLAEPNLTASSGEKAAFLVGGSFPVPIAQDGGVTTVQFRDFGVGLSFTPTILGRNRIQLKVRPEISQLSSAGAVQANGFSIPSLTKRSVETTVEVGSGQSFVLAGLLQNTTNHNLSDVPGLKEIPVLGALFRSDAFRRQETELMVIVTPFLVRPTSAHLPLPTDNYVPPKDLERFLLGRNHVAQPPTSPPAPLDRRGKPGLVGPAGFVLQ